MCIAVGILGVPEELNLFNEYLQRQVSAARIAWTSVQVSASCADACMSCCLLDQMDRGTPFQTVSAMGMTEIMITNVLADPRQPRRSFGDP